jgi:hypothetical protein
MIFTYLSVFALSVLNLIISLAPDASSGDLQLIENATNAINNLKDIISGYNWIFPLDDIFFCVRFFILTAFVIWSFRFLRWLASNLSAGIFK